MTAKAKSTEINPNLLARLHRLLTDYAGDHAVLTPDIAKEYLTNVALDSIEGAGYVEMFCAAVVCNDLDALQIAWEGLCYWRVQWRWRAAGWVKEYLKLELVL